MGKLAQKLPTHLQWEWSKHLAAQKRSTTDSTWETFKKWIEEILETAVLSKLTAMTNSTDLAPSKPSQIKKPLAANSSYSRVFCYMCGKAGHLAQSCPQPASLAKANALCEAFEVNAM